MKIYEKKKDSFGGFLQNKLFKNKINLKKLVEDF